MRMFHDPIAVSLGFNYKFKIGDAVETKGASWCRGKIIKLTTWGNRGIESAYVVLDEKEGIEVVYCEDCLNLAT